MMNQFVLPKFTDENTFEDLVTDLYMRRFGTSTFQRYGKKGQKQYGVDSVGIVHGKCIGIQCKNHADPGAKITVKEIDDEIRKSETFVPELDEYYIMTSAERDASITSYVLTLALEREKQGRYPIHIQFWQDICHELNDYPDIVYTYFTRYFLRSETIVSPGLASDKEPLLWPCSRQEMEQYLQRIFQGIPLLHPYSPTIEISSFSPKDFSKKADIHVYFSDARDDAFSFAVEALRELKTVLSTPMISKDLIFIPQTRISFAFLVGWMFRSVTAYRLTLVMRDSHIWRTYNMPYVESNVYDEMPVFLEQRSQEFVVVLNISRHIQESVLRCIATVEQKPKAVLGFSLQSHIVESSAHAFAVARHIAKKLKTLIDVWGASALHLYAAMPAGLATLIAYHLNAICPLHLYDRDETLRTYRCAGIITNRMDHGNTEPSF